jgi:hypothetical protein
MKLGVVALVGVATLALSGATLAPDSRRMPHDPSTRVLAGHGSSDASSRTRIPDGWLQALGLVTDRLELVGSFKTNGNRHDVFLGPAEDGTMCLVQNQTLGTTPDGQPLRVFGKSCSVDLLRARALTFSLGQTGGGRAELDSLSLVGVARSDVAQVTVTDSMGTAQTVPLNRKKGFSFEVPAALVAKGVRLTEITAYGRDGEQLESYELRE